MKEIMFLKPIFKECIWGGNRLKKDFLYDISNDNIGECWAVSAHEGSDCIIENGCFKGYTLGQLWKEHHEVFGNATGDCFPLLIKIIDAKTDLSIQVHPDDAYANEHENHALGKTECWYVLDCKDDAKIVIGHHAKNKQELVDMIHNNEWDKLLRELPIKKGDFFQIEPGTIHAIKGGTLLLETQKNSDITYRLYDYGRLQKGKPRELHIEKSIDVISCPHKDIVTSPKITRLQGAVVEQLINCDVYTVNLIYVTKKQRFTQEEAFTICSVVEGEGMIDDIGIKKGDHFILSNQYGEYELSGKMCIVSSHI